MEDEGVASGATVTSHTGQAEEEGESSPVGCVSLISSSGCGLCASASCVEGVASVTASLVAMMEEVAGWAVEMAGWAVEEELVSLCNT